MSAGSGRRGRLEAGAGAPGGTPRTGPVLTTSRLELRPFAPEDGEALHALFTNAGVRRWLLDGELVAREWVDGEIERSAARFAGGGCGLWSIREPGPIEEPDAGVSGGVPRAPAELVGFVGFRHFWDPPELELVYGLHPSVWGRGLAVEAGRAAMSYAFDELGFGEVLAATDAPNTASIAVLERLGFEEWKRTDDGPAGTVHFRITERRWREAVTTRR